MTNIREICGYFCNFDILIFMTLFITPPSVPIVTWIWLNSV